MAEVSPHVGTGMDEGIPRNEYELNESQFLRDYDELADTFSAQKTLADQWQ